jgi:aryl-alcohol dehydrogenase-like predicted oxidoreductase
MRYGTLPGIRKPVSRFIIGVDNQRTREHANLMFDDFLELGGNAFDTAWVYLRGLPERLLGDWVSERGVREQVIIIGKGAHTPFCTPEWLSRQIIRDSRPPAHRPSRYLLDAPGQSGGAGGRIC